MSTANSLTLFRNFNSAGKGRPITAHVDSPYIKKVKKNRNTTKTQSQTKISLISIPGDDTADFQSEQK